MGVVRGSQDGSEEKLELLRLLSKLGKRFVFYEGRLPVVSNLNNSYKSEFNSGFKNAIVDLNVLAGVFSEAVKCLQCGATGLNLSCEENCSGGAVELDIICDICSYSYNFCSSKKCKAEIGKPSTYEVNTRLVYAMRCIGKGAEAARMFCGIMNLPPPPTKVLKVQ
ncbi:uncharacterized protein TNCV_2818861 [Trichonephila clavipes]|nr:uncharacterized protein TNCV_2818861 [Trichonephila clavipes]